MAEVKAGAGEVVVRGFTGGVFAENCYLVACARTGAAILVDPGAATDDMLAEAQRAGINEGGRSARKHQRHRDAEAVVDLPQLTEIGQLVRSGDVTDRGEERVLNDRPQEHVRTERCGRCFCLLDQIRRVVFELADAKLPTLLPDWPATVVEPE